MKRLIIPIVIALLAGIGGGSGYAYMHTAPIVAADSTATDSTATDSTARGTAARDSTSAASHDSAKHAATDSVIVDSMQSAHSADSVLAAGRTTGTAPLPLTPSDSIRAMQAARATIKSEVKADAEHKSTRAPSTQPALSRPSGKLAAQSAQSAPPAAVKGPPAANTQQVAEAVRSARNDALNTALPEQRLAKIFGAMQAKDAAKVLEQMTDTDIRTILGLMSDRQAAAIISTLPALRAATITRGAVRAPGGTTP